MLGFLAILIICFMIYTLVKNALVATQLSSGESYSGTIELLIPLTPGSRLFTDAWLESLNGLQSLQGRLKIHVLADGPHESMTDWQMLKERLPFIELHHFPMRPSSLPSTPWMLEQIKSAVQGEVVIIGDPEIVGDQHAFLSLARFVKEQERCYFTLPQTARNSLAQEAIAVLNPTLALASMFGFKRYRRNISHPLMSIAQGWLAMPLKVFHELKPTETKAISWKQAVVRQWQRDKVKFYLAFGEKFLVRHYSADMFTQLREMKSYWQELWIQGERKGLWIYALVLFIWSFPVVCFVSHPYWSIATTFLLIIYRFFSKIVFQERWRAIVLHPLASLAWIGTFIWWATSGLKSRYGTQGRLKT